MPIVPFHECHDVKIIIFSKEKNKLLVPLDIETKKKIIFPVKSKNILYL